MGIVKKIAAPLVALGLVAAFGSTANAGVVLEFSDGHQVVDNGAGDTNATVGWISTSYFVGGLTTFVQAVTMPILGSTDRPWMHMDVLATGLGSMAVMFTDTDFDNDSGGAFNSSIGGITYGSVSYMTYADTGNIAFGTGQALGDLGPFTNTAFGAQSTDGLLATDPFSLTMMVAISHSLTSTAGIVSSVNADLRNVPEPAALGLLGLGLVGFGAMRRLRKRA